MAHNLKGRGTAVLDIFSGTVSLAQPEDLPEGGSPRNQNCDFTVGTVATRRSLQNKFSYQGGSVAKLPALGTSVPNGVSQPWTNPAGVEGPSSFASVSFGGAGQAKAPGTVVTAGIGIPWNDPPDAAATGAGSNQIAAIIGFSITGNVVTFNTAPQAVPLVAGQTVGISGLATGTYLNGQSLTVLSSGLSSTTFEAAFTHGDVSATFDIGEATPTTAFAYAQNVAGYTPPGGQSVIFAFPAGAQPASGVSSGTCFGSALAPWAFVAGNGYGVGVNGCPFMTPAGWVSTAVGSPTLPAGAVIQSIIPVSVGTKYGGGGINFSVNYPTGTYEFSMLGSLEEGPDLGTDLAVLDGTTFESSIGNTAESSPGSAVTFGFNVSFYGVAINYTVSGAPIPSTQLQTLAASDFGFAVESGALSGVQVNLDAGMMTGSAANLAVQLTLGGAPVGTQKFISAGSWATGYTLGGGSDLWGLPSLTGAQVNGPGGIGVNVSGTLPDGSQINLNSLSITITAPAPTVADFLDATEYGFDLTSPVTGLAGSFTAFGSGVVSVQLLIAGVPAGTSLLFTLPGSSTPITFGAPLDTWGLGGLTDAQLNATNFGLRFTLVSGTSANIKNAQLIAWIAPAAANFDYVTTFEDNFGDIYTLALDSNGNFWLENVLSTPGVFTPLFEGVPNNSFASSFTADSRQFIAISDLLSGNYPPQSYGQYRDRISQVGPGQAPTFTPISAAATTYAISTITQPPVFPGNGFSYFLQSSGPGSTSPGSTVTVYYSDSTLSGPNEDLVTAFNSGFPVYLWFQFAGIPVPFGFQVVQVTSIGEASPPAQPRKFYYFTFTVPSVAFTYYPGEGQPSYIPTWQRSLATMRMSVPVPGLEVGGMATVSGSSLSGYDSTWTISQTPNSGAFTITQTQVSGGVATYSYQLITGAVPAVGQQVTITGTNNADGQLNLINASIVSASGGDTGTFTVNVSLPDATVETEEGQATTAGTVFCFDPGAALVGSTSDPIIGDATGGTLTFAGNGQFVSPGTRRGTVYFITRNGFWTSPAPPIVFSAAGDTITGLQVTNIPIGPPNVIARAIVLTEAGANGVPGASYYTIPDPVTYVVDNVTYTTSSFFINDNTSTSAVLSFSDAVLLNATEIDIQGGDLFNLVEIGDAAWCAQYHGRSVFGRVNNKIQNFVNLSFDGGYLANPGAAILPLGWQVNSATVPAGITQTLEVSPIFGNSYYVQNSGLRLAIVDTAMTSGTATYTYTGPDPTVGNLVTVTGTTNGSGVFNVTGATIATVNTGAGTFTVTGLSGTFGSAAETGTALVTGAIAVLGMIFQSAYQDWNNVPILQNQTAYSVRVWARTPSGATEGNLVIDLTTWSANSGFGSTFGSFILPLSSMTTAMKQFTGTILIPNTVNIPAGLQLRAWMQNLAPGGDVEIDSIQPFPTIDPVNLTGVTISYEQDWESFDDVTGGTDTNTVNAQPANGAFVIHDQLYILKEGSLGYLSDTPGQEPANWNPFREVSNVAGASGINAFDVGEEWAIMACQNGLYAFNGGAPVPIHQEILEIWRSINWNYGHTICVRNDVARRHILISVPMATPNQWCPDFPVNANPTTPNVILCLDYKGVETIEELMQGAPMHITMMGKMAVHDLRRKWSLWSITSPYMAVCKRSELFSEMLVCSGLGDAALSSFQNEIPGADNGVPFTHSYCTYPFVDEGQAEQNPMLGQWNKRYAWWDAILSGQGTASLTFLQNILAAPYPWTVPGGLTLTDPATNDLSGPLNEYAMRMFVEIKMSGLNTHFNFARFRMAANPDPWQPIR